MKKTVAFHSNQLGDRGTEICLYKYAKYNRDILGNRSIIISSSSKPYPSASRFKEFTTYLYPHVWQNDKRNDAIRSCIEDLCDKEKVTHFYAIKFGDQDGIMPKNVKSLAHCVFTMSEPHGDVYAGVCKYISDKFGSIHPYVFHIVEKEAPHIHSTFREEFGIPSNALVLGRHGGKDTFNLPFVWQAISNALQKRKDLYFVFLNTNEFINHERVKFLPWTMDEEIKAKFVNTCDAMMHARADGEIFSLSTAEFSVRNKPIITWSPDVVPSHYDTGHLVVLQDTCIKYKTSTDLLDILLNLSNKDIANKNWDVYSNTYSPSNVMSQFDDVFLK
jgi:hypothetical protein